jgi:ankyrin repeat protein
MEHDSNSNNSPEVKAPAIVEWSLPLEVSELVATHLERWSDVVLFRNVCRATRNVCQTSRPFTDWMLATQPLEKAMAISCGKIVTLDAADMQRIAALDVQMAFIQASKADSNAMFDALATVPEAKPDHKALAAACAHGHHWAVIKLVRWPGRAAFPNEAVKLSMFVACKNGHADVVDQLLGSKLVSPNADQGRGLSIAAQQGHTVVARTLMLYGATPDVGNCRAVMTAAIHNRVAMLRVLLGWGFWDFGPPPVRADCLDGLALVKACGYRPQGGHTNAPVFQDSAVHLLLSWHHHPPRPDCMDCSALLVACACAHASVIEALLAAPQHAARANARDSAALMVAAREGRADIVSMLLTYPSDPAKTNSTGGVAALAHASKGGHLQVMELLLASSSGDLRADCNDGAALVAACASGQSAAVDLLLARKHDAPRPDCRGWAPFIKACEGGHASVVRRLFRCGGDLTMVEMVLETVCRSGHASTLQVLLTAFPGADYDNIPASLMAACENGHAAIVELLLRHCPRACCDVIDDAAEVARSRGHVAIAHALA